MSLSVGTFTFHTRDRDAFLWIIRTHVHLAFVVATLEFIADTSGRSTRPFNDPNN